LNAKADTTTISTIPTTIFFLHSANISGPNGGSVITKASTNSTSSPKPYLYPKKLLTIEEYSEKEL